ncbi:MAG: AMP-binding protein [Gammaproteobacteria bacterium]|nr:AMP-binding protein [Gammaproteobacteria bacterium]MDH3856981.1 AMP-binding protein [Gammaproteobacteria bacterium]
MNAIAKSYFHRGGEHPLLGTTIAEHFLSIVGRFSDREAVVSLPQQRRLNYRELSEAVDRLARGMASLGFGRGDRIGLWSTNNIEWLLVQMATARIGVILVNINPAYRLQELSYVLQQSKLQGLFVIPSFRSSDYVAMLLELIPEIRNAGPEIDSKTFPNLSRVFLFDPANAENTESPAPGFTPWQDLILAAETFSEEKLQQLSAALDRDDVINIQYTSGTTGFPKAVMLTHHNILNNAWFSAQSMYLDERDRLVVPVPFYHCFGMVLANLLCFSVGACVVIGSEHFDAKRVLEAITSERCSAIHGVPTMFIEILEHPEFERFDLSSLRTGIIAGAPCPPELMTRVIEEMHCSGILIGYGETEASPLTHLTTGDDSFERRIETVGHNLPHQEVKVVDTKTGATVALGEIGEICFRGYHVMRGYYDEPDKTAQAIDPAGWLYSGDLGTMDVDGYIRITGRRKEMIIRGGENIYPREIEDFLFSHPKIAEVAVFGVPDERLGEQVAAWVQMHSGQNATEDEIRAFCKDRIAHFKIPEYIRFVDEFPMTVTGKLQKFKMRETMQSFLQQETAVEG